MFDALCYMHVWCVLSPLLVQGNAAAKSTIISTWPLASPQNSMGANGGSSTQDTAVNNTAGGTEGAAGDGTAHALLPKLQPGLYVDEDTLSRLFLVTSKVSKEVKVRLMHHLFKATQQYTHVSTRYAGQTCTCKCVQQHAPPHLRRNLSNLGNMHPPLCLAPAMPYRCGTPHSMR